jgi:alkanesulfonate monooxygenase SsuD/methylene tetrahydromethanopterin reductase-like flavin-dependent oxidoreductase (luciferase family)
MIITGDIGDDPKFVKDLAQALEGAGFEGLLTNDHVAGGHPDRQRPGEKVHTYDVPCHEPLVFLSFLGAVTTTLELATDRRQHTAPDGPPREASCRA